MNQFIIKIPVNTDFGDLPQNIKSTFQAVKGEFAPDKITGSVVVEGYELRMILTNVNQAALTAQLNARSIDWTVLCVEGDVLDDMLILPFMADKAVMDNDGNVTGLTPYMVADLVSLQTYAGHSWTL